MGKTKTLLWCGLALLSLVFAISCANPSVPEPPEKDDTEITVEKVKITYDNAGKGVAVEAKEVDKGTALEAADLPVLEAEDCIFTGWFYGTDNNTKAEAGYKVEADLKLTAKWIENAVIVNNVKELQDAVASEIGTIIIGDDMTLAVKADRVNIQRDVTIDLNGKSITTKADNTTDFYPFIIGGNSKVTMKNGVLSHSSGTIIDYKNAELTMDNVTIKSTVVNGSLQIRSNTVLNLNSCDITGVIVLMETGSTVNVNSGTTMKAVEKDGAIQSLTGKNSIYLKAGSTVISMDGTAEGHAYYAAPAEIKENAGTVTGVNGHA